MQKNVWILVVSLALCLGVNSLAQNSDEWQTLGECWLSSPVYQEGEPLFSTSPTEVNDIFEKIAELLRTNPTAEAYFKSYADTVGWEFGDQNRYAQNTMAVARRTAAARKGFIAFTDSLFSEARLKTLEGDPVSYCRGTLITVVKPPYDASATDFYRLEKGFVNLDRRVKVLESKDEEFQALLDSLPPPTPPESKPRFSWSLLTGWQGVTFLDERDLSVPSFGIRLSAYDFYVQALGGIYPWSSEGYAGYWYRDVLGTLVGGCHFWQPGNFTLAIEAGGVIGWEYTTSQNQYSLQMNGIIGGFRLEYQVSDWLSLGGSVNFVHAETEDVTPRSGIMRNGVAGSLYLKLF